MTLSPTLLPLSSSGPAALRGALSSHPQPAFARVAPGFSKQLSPAQLATLLPALLDPLRPDGLLLLHDARAHLELAQWQAALDVGLDPVAPLLDSKKQFLPAASPSPAHRAGGWANMGIFSTFGFGCGSGLFGGGGGRPPTVKNLVAQPLGPLLDALIERTPLHGQAYQELGKQLQLSGDDPDSDYEDEDEDLGEAQALTDLAPGAGDSLMHFAAASGMHELVELIGRRSPKALSALNTKKQTPLHLAAQFLQGKTMSALLDAGAAIDPKDIQQYTPLAQALLFSTAHYPAVGWNDKFKDAVMQLQAETGCILLTRGAQYDKGPGRTLQSVVMMKNAEMATKLKASYELYQMQSQIAPGAKSTRARL